MIEIWHQVTEFSRYEISNKGRVKKKAYEFIEREKRLVKGVIKTQTRTRKCVEKIIKPSGKSNMISLFNKKGRLYITLNRLMEFHFNEEL